MAEKEHKHKKKKPHKIITTRAEDGSFGHEHVAEPDGRPVFAGTSQNMQDLHQHMDDHLGGDDEQAEQPADGEAQPAAEAPGE